MKKLIAFGLLALGLMLSATEAFAYYQPWTGGTWTVRTVMRSNGVPWTGLTR